MTDNLMVGLEIGLVLFVILATIVIGWKWKLSPSIFILAVINYAFFYTNVINHFFPTH